MKNRQYNSDTSIYYITGAEHVTGVDIITLQYSQAGVVTAFDGYSDTVLAKAGGGGYCKQSHALSRAINEKYGLNIGGAGAGINMVIKLAKEAGLTVYDNNAISTLVYEDYKNKN